MSTLTKLFLLDTGRLLTLCILILAGGPLVRSGDYFYGIWCYIGAIYVITQGHFNRKYLEEKLLDKETKV